METAVCALSPDEFQRVQEQILELRTANYKLIEENRKITNELKSLQALKESERVGPLDVFTPKRLNDFKRRFLKSEDAEGSPKSEFGTEEESIRKQNENLQQELRSLVEVNRFLQNQIDSARESSLQTEQVSLKEFEMLSCERIDLMHTVEDLRKKIEALDAEKLECQMKEKAASECQARLHSDMGRLQESYMIVVKEKDQVVADMESKCSEQEKVIVVLEAKIGEYQLLVEDYKKQLSASESRESDLLALCDKIRSELEDEHKEKLKQVVEAMEKEKKEKDTEIELVTAQLNEMENTVKALRQDLVDAVEDRKLDERKGAAALRDLKRQLQAEKKRAEKLQDRLKELSPNDDSKDDSGSVEIDRYSVSSWSVMSGEGPRTMSRPKSTKSSGSDIPEAPIHHSSPILDSADVSTDVTCETVQLIARVAELQEEKSVLEERVRHLEAHASTAAEELLRRGKLIERYCMDGGRPHSKAVSAASHQNAVFEKLAGKMNGIFPKHSLAKADDQKQQMLRLLEETLTKNMHLQDDIELLVQEVQKFKSLSKENL